ncbi:MAG TPA: PH domain-containing protein [Candidatus Nitrosocosmicus sp.]
MTKKKDEFITKITDGEELEEIKKIANLLNPDEEVHVVARQSRFKPGGSRFTPHIIFATDRRLIIRDPTMLGLKEEVIDIPYNLIANARLEKGVFSSSVIFNAPGLFKSNIGKKIPGIKRLGTSENGEDGEIDAIPKDKGDKLIEIIRTGISQFGAVNTTGNNIPINRNTNVATKDEKLSMADELEKLANLREKGVISGEEFNKMKTKLMKND